PGLGLQVPHEHCYWLPRAELGKLVAADELPIALDKLPERVTLVSGSSETAWRSIFHARVHRAFDDLLEKKTITTGVIRERVNRIGQTEFDEIRSVLRQEELLLPPVDEVQTYIEFVALYLELQYFAPHFVERTFPALLDTQHIAATIALDIDAGAIL